MLGTSGVSGPFRAKINKSDPPKCAANMKVSLDDNFI